MLEYPYQPQPYRSIRRPSHLDEVREAFDQDALARICALSETEFAAEFGLLHVPVEQSPPDDFYLYKDNGSKILAVAHLDTVGLHHQRTARFVDTEAGLVVFSRALDDRLGAYIILDLLPRLGVEVDWLLTVGEENGRSTAAYFEPPEGKEYNWMIEFDRGGTDVVLYQYDDAESRALVRASGAKPGDGIFSDISYLDHLEIKGFNWGVGYRDYHGPRAHAFLEDTFKMVGHFLNFHEDNVDDYLPHDNTTASWGRTDGVLASRYGSFSWTDPDEDENAAFWASVDAKEKEALAEEPAPRSIHDLTLDEWEQAEKTETEVGWAN